MKKKYQGLRFVVFGRRGGEEYHIEVSSKRRARLEAWFRLNAEYDSYILDQKTNKVIEIKIK